MKPFLLALTLLVPMQPYVQPKFVMLQWTAIDSPGVQGYRIYWGIQSGVYTNTLDVENVSQWPVLVPDTTGKVYLAIAAYKTVLDANGNSVNMVGPKSAEVSSVPSNAPTNLRIIK